MPSKSSFSIWTLIAIPALITLAVTILRLEGELQHWPGPWFSSVAGGGAAIVGISWLPIIFGPYFAWKLVRAEGRPERLGRAFGFAILGLVVLVLGGVWAASTLSHPSVLTVAAFVVLLIAAFIPRMGWRSLGNTMIAYAFAARIPVLVVMFLAMRGNSGAGWGTHYDAVEPAFAHVAFASKFLFTAVLPQMMLWIGYTVVVGSLLGIIVTAAARTGRRPVEADAR